MEPASILVVDDDEGVRSVVVSCLEKAGHRVWQAESGDEAMSHLSRYDLDLVITDYLMPGMDGLSLATKSVMLDPDRPVIMMTGFADAGVSGSSKAMLVFDWIGKPFRIDEFRLRVQRAIKHRRSLRNMDVDQA